MKKCSICGKEKEDNDMLTVGYGNMTTNPKKHYCSCSCIMESSHSDLTKLEMMRMFEDSEKQVPQTGR